MVKCIKDRKAAGQREILVVVSEGARLADELVLLDEKTQGEVRLGGIGKVISKKLEEATGIETRSCVLGHIQRGGSPAPMTVFWACGSAVTPWSWWKSASSAAWLPSGERR